VTVELRPLGITCNIQCQYCYQNPQRDAGNVGRAYDIEAMKSAIEREGGPFTLFGGEPLLLPMDDLDELWTWGLERFGGNSVQTNGTLVTDEHIDRFVRYRVSVGISVDGPGRLNDARWAGSLDRTRAATERSLDAIDRLLAAGIVPSLIVTLHRSNAAADRLDDLIEWFRSLDRAGIESVRLHTLEVETATVSATYGLSAAENVAAFVRCAALERELHGLRFDVFTDIRQLLLGDDDTTTCVWNACDPYTTRAVRGVEGLGQSSNCGRTNKDGIDFLKASVEGFERSLALSLTPHEHGGCADCRFFVMCKGHCPGTAIDGDWRNRTEHCALWFELFETIESALCDAGEVPISRSAERPRIERALAELWASGTTSTIAGVRRMLANRASSELTADANGARGTHGDVPHGDAPHADSAITVTAP